MQLDVGFDLSARQKGHFGPGFSNLGRANVVFRIPERLTYGQSPAKSLSF